MRRFQAMLLVLLTVIGVELGMIVIKLPTPAAHAAPIQAPGTALEDPHDVLKRQIAEFQRELQREMAADRQRLVTIEQQIAKVSQSVQTVSQSVEKVTQNVAMVTANQEKLVSRVNDDSKRLLLTCFMTSMQLGHFLKPAIEPDSKHSLERCTARGPFGGGSLMPTYDIPFGP